MPDEKPLINIGELSKPATLLVQKVSDAIGALFQPWQIRRVAEAEAGAEKIRALAQLDIQDLKYRAVQRFLAQEARKQRNIESITARAIDGLEETSAPQDVNEDWVVNFFDKSCLFSGEQMQEIWAKILAGEANAPGSYSRRTVNLLGSLDKQDAQLFGELCDFIWQFPGGPIPLVFDVAHDIYQTHGLTFVKAKHLNDIGLVAFESLAGYGLYDLPKRVSASYQGNQFVIEFTGQRGNRLSTGSILLTQTGEELSGVCKPRSVPGFVEHVRNVWSNDGVRVAALQE